MGSMKYIKKKILQYVTKHLLRAITTDDLLRATSEGYILGTRKLSPEELISLREEAQQWLESDIWRFMMSELEYLAYVRGRKAMTQEDLYATLYMNYNLDQIQQFLYNLSVKNPRSK